MAKKITKKRKIRLAKITKIAQDFVFSYKKVEEMGRYLTEQGNIFPRKVTNLTAKQQRNLRREIQKARILALLPFTQTL